jgi:GNAT superfamily N-acetyltransferase
VSSYELVSYELEEHRDDYLRLLRDAWGEKALSGEEFDWWFAHNPTGSLMSVARMDGRVVGVASHSLFRMVLGGEERQASFSVHATTDPSARGQGIFAALEERHELEAAERGVAVVLAFASAPTAPIFLGPLGWTEIGRLRVWVRPLGLRRPADAHDPLEIEGDAAASWPNHVVRDAQHLTWRYVDSPRGYRTIRSGEGYAVVGRTRRKGIEAAVLADLVGGRPLLRRAIASASGRALVALPAPAERGLFLSAGFVPVATSLHFMGKALAGTLNTDPRAWRFTLGDTDFF